MNRPDSINDLIERYLDDLAPAGEVDRLQDRLQESEEAADAFAEAVLFDTLLQTAFSEKSPAIDDAFSALVADAPFAAPAPGLLGGIKHNASNFLQLGGMPFAYLTSAVVLALIMLVGSIIHVSHSGRYAAHRSSPGGGIEQGPIASDPSPIVGKITALVDVKWSDELGYLPPLGYASVPLGRKYVLVSGLMEITYRSGAKVILQGPCTFEVESDAGGYLTLGKLTVRIEKKGREGEGEKGRLANSTIRSPRLPVSPSPVLFAVRTPTAVVTDLGTEFGVSVDENGDTTSHVFQGTVRVARAGGGGRGMKSPSLQISKSQIILAAGETVQVGRVRETHHASGENTESVRFTHPTTPPKFVRRIVKPIKDLDLLDIVAGGDGRRNRRDRGIDPLTGESDAVYAASFRDGDGQYRRVRWHDFIDGVFVPGGGTVQLDSAGHVFDGFPRNDGRVYGTIWSRAADFDEFEIPEIRRRPWIYVMGRGEQFMPRNRGMLNLASNAGITFDLAAIRDRFPGSRPSRFHAVGGIGDARLFDGQRDQIPADGAAADLWVFVDGQLKLKRTQLRPKDGPINVDIELGPKDRFLTLVTTDGDANSVGDWVVFGDPVLEMTYLEDQNAKGGPAEQQ